MFRCFATGAVGTSCELTVTSAGPDYTDLRPDVTPLEYSRANAEARGRFLTDAPEAFVGAAIDMGNVSLVVPNIHPLPGLDCAPAGNHQPEFTVACICSVADRAIVDGAIAMAWTAADFAAGR